jgi:hypothetical protein
MGVIYASTDTIGDPVIAGFIYAGIALFGSFFIAGFLILTIYLVQREKYIKTGKKPGAIAYSE